MNHITTSLAVLVTSLLSAGSVRADVTTFARPSFWYVSYDQKGMSSKAGGALSGGLQLGEKGEHEFAAEVARLSWAQGNPTFWASGDGHFTPLLASYRYYVGTGAAAWRLYGGLSAGMAKSEGSVRFVGSGISYHGDYSDWKRAVGGMIGGSWALAPQISLEFGYRYLAISGTDVNTQLFAGSAGYVPGGPRWHVDAAKCHIAEIGVKIAF